MHKIILTFDLEYWFESLSIQKYLTGSEQESLSEFIDRLLNLLKRANSTATFFVTGKVLDKEPETVKKISHVDHEIAIHSLDHKPLWYKNSDQFDVEIKKMITEIEKVTGQRPIGHRATSFSINQNTKWALRVLSKNKIKYDSSIFPFKFSPILLPMFKDSLYGLKINMFSPYKIDLNNPQKKDYNSPLIEIPISIYHCSKFKLPLTGGIYIRLIPWLIFKILLKKKLKEEPACFHFHPFDFFNQAPDIKMPKFKKFIKFYNTKNTFKKLENIISNFECVSVKQYLTNLRSV
jgi:polysaccharide deacetylase family protein (PEP-CTERM system associated)